MALSRPKPSDYGSWVGEAKVESLSPDTLKHVIHNRTMKRTTLLKAIATVTGLIVAVILVSEAFNSPKIQCTYQGYQQLYIGWDDFAGPCTYVQRVTSSLFMFMIFPFGFLFPVTLAAVIYAITGFVRHKRLSDTVIRELAFFVLLVLSLSLIFLLLVTLHS